jgi:hypothetical protein
MRVWVISLKEREKEMKQKKRGDKDSYISKNLERRSTDKDQNFPKCESISPSSLNIIPSIRLEFDQVPTSYKPFFGSATKVTKVCYTLSTHETPYISPRVGRRWSKFRSW